MVQLKIVAASSNHTSTHEAYVYPDSIRQFAQQLKDFGSNVASQAVLESGGRGERAYGYARLRALVLEPTGHSAIEVEFETRGKPPNFAKCHFFAAGEPATFNELGTRLSEWCQDMAMEFVYEWRDA